MNASHIKSQNISRDLAFAEGTLAAEAADVAPRSARSRIRPLFTSLWQFLKVVGSIRARTEMVRVAAQCQASRPELAARLRAAAQQILLG